MDHFPIDDQLYENVHCVYISVSRGPHIGMGGRIHSSRINHWLNRQFRSSKSFSFVCFTTATMLITHPLDKATLPLLSLYVFIPFLRYHRDSTNGMEVFLI